ncbi:phytochrome-like protein cph2 [mine drainage metagenome]|uniref:Phytochrome-like protein cph2 n=1 Tax=mine drainage metagenome TaxID=410659 RepID=A0A1J5SRA6_9ZZZZ
MREAGAPLTLDEAISKDLSGAFTVGSSPILTFGINSNPVWIRLSVTNPSVDSLNRQLLIENSWLDHLDVYFVRDHQLINKYSVGDSLPFLSRPIVGRFFSFNHAFDVGTTNIYLRVETPDPIVVPIFLLSSAAVAHRETMQGYSYGFLYGYLLALLAYNLLIFIGLRHKRHLLYAVFIAVFIVTNIAYTGHGFAWLWPENVTLQRWIIPVLMLVYGVVGLAFAKHFLNTRTNFPRAHKIATWACALFAALLVMAIVADKQLYALLDAFVFVTFFSVMMLTLGLMSCYSGYRYARYFLFASIASMLGTGTTALSVWGFIPFNDWTYRAVELGMLIDATLLALALADQLRSIQLEWKLAEQLAARDPLTALNNRRAFLEKVQPIWSIAQRSKRDLSLIILDIDHFKSINDRYGHAAGDLALVAVSKLLADSARDGDVVARWGGEEFLILLSETKLEAAIIMAERLRVAISEINLPSGNNHITLTASFGVAYMDQHATLDALISEADGYLYQSKAKGRNLISSKLG